MSGLHVTTLDHWEPHLLDDWNQLVAASSASSIFLTRQWLTSWWDAFGDGRELLLLLCHDAKGELVGVVPLYRTRARTELGLPLQVLRLVGDGSFDSDNLDFITRPGREAEVASAVLDWLSGNPRGWDLLELGSVPSDSICLGALLDGLAARGWSKALRVTPHPVIELPDTWEGYLASLSGSTRSGLRRKLRELDKHHQVRLRRCEREEELPGFLESLYHMHSDRWHRRGQPGSFESPARQAFYDGLARGLLVEGWLAFWMLEVDGEPAAAEFGFRHGRTHSFLQAGFSPKHADQSVGVVLKCFILQQLIRDGVRQYDFLGGGEAYKLRWGPQARTHVHLRCARPRSAGAAFLELSRLAVRSKGWLLARLPESIARPLRTTYRRLRPHRGGLKHEPS